MCILAASNRRGLAALLATALLTGCTVGPDFQRPSAPSTKNYAPGGDPAATVTASGVSQKFPVAARLPADWWRLFDCDALNNAVREGLTASPTIAAAQATLRQAQDELRSGAGIFYPQVGAGAGVSRQHPSGDATPAGLKEGTFNLFTLSASVDYVLDIFGGERRTVEALGAQVEFQKNASRAASLTLAANIANTLIAIAAYQAEIRVTDELVRTEQNQVRLAHVQASAGTGTYAAELSLQSQLETTQAGLPALEQQLARARHLLAVLEGHLPADAPLSAISFDQIFLPHDIPLSVPSDLVQQRPDILQAEATLHAASAEIGVATAAMLPSITLGGSVGYSAISSASLFAGPSSVWSVGAGVTQPIFNGGTLWFHREAARDAFNAANAQYRQTVLSAFEQVADSLRALEHDAQALSIREQSLKTSQGALKLVDVGYKAGLSTYSDLLLADGQLHQAEIAEIEARAQRYQDTVALFVSLGGGWWNAPNSPDKLAAGR